MFLSVIIPTYNRAKYLSGSLASLVAQDLAKEYFEVIVVDDGSFDNTEGTVDQFRDKMDLKFIKALHGGVCRARNTGIKNSRGDVLVFFDDDAVADVSWLSSVKRVMAVEYVAVGRGRPITNNIWQYFAPHYNRGDAPLPLTTIWECNLAVRLEVFDKAGMFDERIGWGHEGNEFANRCMAGGYAVMYRPEMVIGHDYASGFYNYFKKQFMFGQKLIYLKIGEIKKFSDLVYNYKGIKGSGDGSVNNALESLNLFKKLLIKIVARLGSWIHFYGSVIGYLKYRKSVVIVK